MAKANVTVRLAWGAIPLAMLAAALFLVIFNGPLNADDSPTVWDFEDEDALAGWMLEDASPTSNDTPRTASKSSKRRTSFSTSIILAIDPKLNASRGWGARVS